jgi:hypothetical protein
VIGGIRYAEDFAMVWRGLNAVAVELDLVNPTLADGTLSTDVASSGSMKPGKAALTPIVAGFLRWNAIGTPRNRISVKADSDQIVPAVVWSSNTAGGPPVFRQPSRHVLRRLNYISAMTLMTLMLRPSPT